MSILSIVEVSGKDPYVQFYLELSENTYFAFKMFNDYKSRKKLEQIIYGEKNHVSLWKHKPILSLKRSFIPSEFYYRDGIFHYVHYHQITDIQMEDEHYEAIHNFLISLDPTSSDICVVS